MPVAGEEPGRGLASGLLGTAQADASSAAVAITAQRRFMVYCRSSITSPRMRWLARSTSPQNLFGIKVLQKFPAGVENVIGPESPGPNGTRVISLTPFYARIAI